MTLAARTSARARVRPLRLLIVVLAGLLLGIGSFWIVSVATQPRRTTPVYDPPVLAGQQLWNVCAGGFYARHGDTIVLTSTCLLYTSPSPRDGLLSRMPSSA